MEQAFSRQVEEGNSASHSANTENSFHILPWDSVVNEMQSLSSFRLTHPEEDPIESRSVKGVGAGCLGSPLRKWPSKETDSLNPRRDVLTDRR
jgi:hypothetical protein